MKELAKELFMVLAGVLAQGARALATLLVLLGLVACYAAGVYLALWWWS